MDILVTVTQEATFAYINAFVENRDEKPELKVSDFEKALAEAGIVIGIKKDVLEDICKNKRINEKVIAAESIAPKIGNDARVEIIKKPKKPDEIKPVKKENDEIDYYAPREGFITYVRTGETLAIKYPPTRGESGMNVYGKTMPGRLGKEISLDLFRGKHTKIKENKLIAENDGIIEIEGLFVNAETTFKINNNVGRGTGSIDLPKDLNITLIINGDIQKGLSVKCNKLYVTGCIEDAEVDCNILKVKGGIVGIGDKPIKAESIYVGFINGERKISGRVIIAVREISSGAKVMADVIKAYTIQGSSATSTEAIWTDYINGKNTIMVGIDYKAKLEYDELTKKIAEISEPLEELKTASYANAKRMKQLAELSKINPKHPLLVKELPKIKAIKEKLAKFEQINEALSKKRDECEKNIYSSVDPFLLVRSGFAKDTSSGMTVDPDTVITMKDETEKIFESASGGLFYLSKYGISSSARYNIKELKMRFDKILFDVEESVNQRLSQDKKQKPEARSQKAEVNCSISK